MAVKTFLSGNKPDRLHVDILACVSLGAPECSLPAFGSVYPRDVATSILPAVPEVARPNFAKRHRLMKPKPKSLFVKAKRMSQQSREAHAVGASNVPICTDLNLKAKPKAWFYSRSQKRDQQDAAKSLKQIAKESRTNNSEQSPSGSAEKLLSVDQTEVSSHTGKPKEEMEMERVRQGTFVVDEKSAQPSETPPMPKESSFLSKAAVLDFQRKLSVGASLRPRPSSDEPLVKKNCGQISKKVALSPHPPLHPLPDHLQHSFLTESVLLDDDVKPLKAESFCPHPPLSRPPAKKQSASSAANVAANNARKVSVASGIGSCPSSVASLRDVKRQSLNPTTDVTESALKFAPGFDYGRVFLSDVSAGEKRQSLVSLSEALDSNNRKPSTFVVRRFCPKPRGPGKKKSTDDVS